MRDIDLEHPDITCAQSTGYPRQRPVEMPTRREVEQAFLEETQDDFFRFCRDLSDIVEEYLAENQIAFQDFQWETWGLIEY